MTKKIFKIMLWIAVMAWPLYVTHADTVGISVDQSVFSFSLDPGAQKEFQITLTNISDYEENISLEPQDFSMGNNNAIENAVEVNELNGMKQWISSSQKNLALKSKEKVQIPVVVTVPFDATVGSHYAILSVNVLPQIDAQNFQKTLVGGRIGIYVLVNVKGMVSGKGEIKSFSAPIITNETANITAEFENTGNIHYMPHGEIHIKNLLTRKTQDLETEKHFVFPGKRYAFELSWQPSSIFAAYKAEAFFIDGDGSLHISQRFMFGKLFFIIPVLSLCLLFVAGRKYYQARKSSI